MLKPHERLKLGDRLRERSEYFKSARIRGLPEADRDSLGRDFIGGMLVRDLSKKYGLCNRTIYEHLKRLALGI